MFVYRCKVAESEMDAAPVVRGTYVRATHVRAFLSGGTFVRGNICPGEHLSGEHLSGYVSSGLGMVTTCLPKARDGHHISA